MRHGARAFTLLETLMAVTLMAVVATAAYGLLHGGMTARRVVGARVRESRALALALDQVARRVESALPPTGVLAGEFIGEDAADGMNHDLTFHCALDARGTRWADVRKVHVYVEISNDGAPCLMLGTVTNLLAAAAPDESPQVLCRSVGAFDVEYCDGGAWVDTWNSTDNGNALPDAVRLTLTLAPEDDQAEALSLQRVIVLSLAGGEEGDAS
ncbi:MAG: prepilin-type N-terminal cleavage/methylation domain-containing protein [Planctomycetes bacterium]|nr:prepilin-type N-terminal cleavage/methylation domain-containing protein [Planctomycetota bacterium]